MYAGPSILNKFDAEIVSAISGRNGRSLFELMNGIRNSFPDDESMIRFFDYANPEEVIGFVCLHDIELSDREALRKGTPVLAWPSMSPRSIARR
jgi:hypothetical protein